MKEAQTRIIYDYCVSINKLINQVYCTKTVQIEKLVDFEYLPRYSSNRN